MYSDVNVKMTIFITELGEDHLFIYIGIITGVTDGRTLLLNSKMNRQDTLIKNNQSINQLLHLMFCSI
jgi:hypothetical protein